MTVKRLFESAMDLLGERRKDGSFTSNSVYLTSRAVTVVNNVLAELVTAQSALSGGEYEMVAVQSLNDTVELDNRLLYSAVPAGIAAILMLGEDDDRYSAFRMMFDNAVRIALKSEKANISPIVDIYK